MKEIILDTYAENKTMIFDWYDKKNYLIHYRMLKFYIRHGKEVEKVRSVISIKQSKWLEEYKSFITQRRNKARNDFEKDFYELLNYAFY